MQRAVAPAHRATASGISPNAAATTAPPAPTSGGEEYTGTFTPQLSVLMPGTSGTTIYPHFTLADAATSTVIDGYAAPAVKNGDVCT